MKNLCALTFLIVSLVANGQIQFREFSWKEALVQAEKENKLIFLNACTSWSEPCQLLEKYTLTDLEVANFYNDAFINVSLDMEKYPGIELGEIYEVAIYPAMLFINKDGNVVHRGCGALETAELLELGKVALGEDNLEVLARKFREGNKEEEFLMEYLTLMEESCLDAEGFATNLLQNTELEELVKEESFMLIESYQWDIFSREFKYLIDNRDRFEEVLGRDRVHDKIFNTYLAQYQEVFEAEELHLFGMRALLSEVKNTTFSGSDTLLTMMNLHYFEILEDWKLYSNYAIDWVGMAGLSDPEELSELAWKFYLFVESKEKLKIAAGWARASVDNDPNPSSIDTYASLLYKLGEKKKAIELEKQAMEMAEELLEDTAHYQHQLAKFQEGQ